MSNWLGISIVLELQPIGNRKFSLGKVSRIQINVILELALSGLIFNKVSFAEVRLLKSCLSCLLFFHEARFTQRITKKIRKSLTLAKLCKWRVTCYKIFTRRFTRFKNQRKKFLISQLH